MFHSTAIIEEGAEIGKNTNVWHYSHVRTRSKIGADCNIGMAVYIDTDVVIGRNCKIQNKSSLYRGLVIEDEVFVGPHVAFTNDMYPRAMNDDFKVIPTLVKKGASIGANSTIRCGITIGEYAMIGAGSVVTKNVDPFALVLGNPGKVVGFVDEKGKKITNS